MIGQFREGLIKATKDMFNARVPDQVRSGSVSQLIPERRDNQVEDLKGKIEAGRDIDFSKTEETNKKEKKDHLEILAKAASTVLQASEGNAYWKERGYKPNSSNPDSDKPDLDDGTHPSLSREEVVEKLVEAMTSRGGSEIKYEMFNNEFCQNSEDDFGISTGLMPAHQRRLFTRVAPLLYEKIESEKLEVTGEDGSDIQKQKLEETQKNMVDKLKSVASGKLETKFVGKEDYSSFSHEAMQALIKIGGGEWRDVINDFLLDPNVKSSDKEDIVAYLPIKNIVDFEVLSTALSKIDKEGMSNKFKKVLEAGLDNLQYNNTRFDNLDGEIVSFKNETKLFENFTNEEQLKITEEKQKMSKGSLLSNDWGGDHQLAEKSLGTIFESKELFNKDGTTDLLFSWGDAKVDHVTRASQTVIESLPEAMKSIGDESIRIKLAEDLFDKIYDVILAYNKSPIDENYDRIIYYLKTMQKVQRSVGLEKRPRTNVDHFTNLLEPRVNISESKLRKIHKLIDRIS